MKKLLQSITLSILAFVIAPFAVLAAPIINVDSGVGPESLCKPIGEIVVNEEFYNNDISVNVLSNDYIYYGNTAAAVSIRAMATNTGDTTGNVNYSIQYNGTPGAYATSHSFTVTVDGKNQAINVNTSPALTKIALVDSYKVVRTGQASQGSSFPYAQSSLPSAVSSTSFTVPPSGNAFGSSFDCSGYGVFWFPTVNQPQTWGFEVGLKNVYSIVKQATVVPQGNCPIDLVANPTTVLFGGSTVLSWLHTSTNNCTLALSCSAVNGWGSGSLPVTGSQTVVTTAPAGSQQTYTIQCNYPNGTSATDSATVNIQQQNNPTNYCPPTLDATPNVVFPGAVVNISWGALPNNVCTQANYCLAQSGWASGQLNTSGNQSYPTSSSAAPGSGLSFTINCHYPDGSVRSATDTITFQGNVNPPQQYGSPTIDANPDSVYPGAQVNLTWSGGNGAVSCQAIDGWAQSINVNGSRVYTTSQGAPGGSNQTFRIRCLYPDGAQRDASDTIQFIAQNIPPNQYQNPNNGGVSGIAGSPIVRTLSARSVEKTSAKLRGYFNANGCPAITTWFEYGPERGNLEFRSDSITQSNKYGNVEFVATNLRPKTKYYYRIVGENCKGVSLGAIESLVTASGAINVVGSQATTNNTTVVRNVTERIVDTSVTATGAGTSYLRLDVTNDNDVPDEDNEPIRVVIRGEVVVYRVVWENLTTSMLRDGKIRVNLPRELAFMNSSNGIYDKDSNSVYMTIGDIPGRASGVEFITVKVTTGGAVGDPVVVEAIAAFDAPKTDAQVNAIDYDEDVLADRVLAAANPFSFNWIWIIGIILLMVLVFLIARYHALASQYRGGGYNQHNYYTPPGPQTPPVVPVRMSEPERDPFVPPSAGSGPVYKPYQPE